MRRHVLVLVIAAALALCPRTLFAQQSIDSASITGTLTDPSGAAVGGASAAIRSTDRNQTHVTQTDDRGRFAFRYLAPGPYELSLTAAGFERRVVTLALTAGQALDISVRLAMSGLASTVEVTADAPLVEARRTQAADTIHPTEVDSLPLNGRNYLDLALLTPGVSRTIQRSTERFAETSAVPGTGISVAGQRNLNNTFIVDGLSANDDAAGLAGTYFAEDVVREFQVVTSGGIAEFGRSSAGIVSIVTQSGSNASHGRAYGFFRDDALDARNPLALQEDPLHQAQYGFSTSGPLVRDRTFWFANAEQTRLDRSGVITIGRSDVDTVNRVLDSAGYGGPRPATGQFPTGYDTTNLFGRVDHSATSAHRLALRYSLYDVASENARNVGGLNAVSRGTRLDNRDQTLASTLLGSLSSSMFNELRGQVTRSRLAAPPNDLIGPAVNIAGTASFGTATFSPTARDLDVYEISDSLTAQRGNHLLKVGANVLHERLDIVFPGAAQGVYSFESLANFLAGRYINYQQAFGEARQLQSNTNAGVFVQDEWRPGASLTVNAGLRYDVQLIEDPVRTDTNNISPRVGVAFAPGNGQTVLRASGGIYYDRIPLRAVSNALQRDGVKYRVALVTFGQPGAPVFPSVLADFPAGILTNVTSIDRDIQNGAGRQFNVQLERQFGPRLSANVGYLHLTGRQIIMSRNTNVPTLSAAEATARGIPNLGRPDHTVANRATFQSIGQSAYNALTVSARASRGRAGSHRLSYTLSRALDDAGNAFFSAPQDNFNVHDDWGRSDNDQRHRLVLSGSAPVAWGVEVAYLYSYASAPPFNIQTGDDRNNDTNANDRPAGVGRNTGEGFDAATLDLRVSRRFTLHAAHRLELMLEGFNVFNRTNFLIPNNTIGTSAVPAPAFGRPTAADDPRQLQLGLRWTF
jgi:hypothetical protein